jgi:hypothetical protein
MELLYSYEDLTVGRRCLRQLRQRLDSRSGLRRPVGPQDFLEYPSGSAATHQFLERYRLEQAYVRAFSAEVPDSEIIFPGSMACVMEQSPCDLEDILALSRRALEDFSEKRIPALVNGFFRCGNRLIRIDRLLRNPDGMIILELAKSASKIKDGYVREAGWNLQGLESLGVRPDEISVLLLNRDRSGSDEPFYRPMRQKRRHKFIRQDADGELQGILQALDADELPSCGSEYCDLCSDDQPKANDWGSIHNLHKSGGLSRKLSEQGILWVDELDQVKSPLREKLKAQHWIQHRVEKTGEEHIDVTALRRFLEGLEWPLYFIDFECFLEALPSWSGVGIWEHAPFLYSLYRMDRTLTVTRLDHYYMPPGEDRRREMAAQLIRDIGKSGSVLVYGIHFERAVISRLAASLADLAPKLEAVIERLVDLQTPFAEFAYYHPHQSGKISLKILLPILTEHDYDSSRVSSGSDAFVGYYYLMHPELLVESEWDPYASQVRRDPGGFAREVVEYCDTDAYGLAFLIKALMQKAGLS